MDKRDLSAVNKQIEKIKKTPLRFKRLHGRENCYAVRSGGLRVIYYVENTVVWFLLVEKRGKVYGIYLKRLYRIKTAFEPST